MAGDIIPLHDEFMNDPFFRFISNNFRQVFWIPGNHEYYYKDISDYSGAFNIKVHGNINIVNNIELQYEGIQFIFSTLWSRIRKVNERDIVQRVSDFECITVRNKKFMVSDFNKLHDESLNFIRKSLSIRKNKTVVVTHYVPSSSCNSAAHNLSSINEAFCVDLTDYIADSNADFWIYGHSHHNQKPLFIGRTIMLTNQLGYVHLNEHLRFRRNAYFSL
jgi:predicted phosphohydrolase